MFLDEIIRRKKEDIRFKKNKNYLSQMNAKLSRLEEAQVGRRPFPSFREVLSKKDQFTFGMSLHLIAEIKKASPSKGIIREDFNPVEIAEIFESMGASAISILTEKNYFMGSLAYLEDVRNKVNLPILRKDFIIDEIEIIEAKAYGASAILLITAILDPNQIYEYFLQAKEIGLDVLVEVHSEKELEQIIEWAPIIGINNRDLSTFVVDLQTTLRLLRYVPKDRIIVSESGLSKKEDLLQLVENDVNAVLIGEALMKEKDIKKAVARLFSGN